MTTQELQDELAQARAEIARLKKTQSSRAYEQEAFYPVLDASPVPQALNDEQQNILYLNPAFIETFGYTLSDIPTISEWWPRAYPNPKYRQQVQDFWQQHLETSQQKNTPFEAFEVQIHCKDGSTKTIMAGSSVLQLSDKAIHLVTLYDVSDIKKIEKKLNKTVSLLENVINSTPDLIVVKNKQLQTELCNEACARAVGKSREEMYGKTDIENGWDPELIEGNPEKGIRGFMHDDLDALSGMDVHNPYDPANIEGKIRIFDTHKLPLKENHTITTITNTWTNPISLQFC